MQTGTIAFLVGVVLLQLQPALPTSPWLAAVVIIPILLYRVVFDTGPRFPSGFNTGQAVVLPYLRQRGVTGIDTLIVSHGDNDHGYYCPWGTVTATAFRIRW